MLSAFLITLREGFEAALIVGILLAYLARSGNQSRVKPLWVGVAAAFALSVAAGAILTYAQSALGDRAEVIFVGTTSFVAAALVTWMIFWMKRTGRALRGELQTKAESALMAGPFAIALTAFLSVSREGLETALFLYSAFASESHPAGAIIGLLLGLVGAVALGTMIYKRSMTFNISKFFTYTGIALILIVGNIIAYGYHEFSELGWLPESNLLRYGTALTYIAVTVSFYLRKESQRTLARV